VEAVLDEPLAIDIDAPLMEAVHAMLTSNRPALPVTREGDLVGVVRDRDLTSEICRIVIR
jgi:CBS domain-containing protein